MADIQLFLVNTFTKKVFHGQAVAVCVLQENLNDELLQAIAIENHLPETAFIQQVNKTWSIRWFNRNGEIFSSGHGLLAAAQVVFDFIRPNLQVVEFNTGLTLTKLYRQQQKIYFEFPRIPYELREFPQYKMPTVQIAPQQVWYLGPDILMLYANAAEVAQIVLERNFYQDSWPGALILTAPSEDVDFYLRCFFSDPEYCEETATVAVYPRLAEFWGERLSKTNLIAEQGLLRRSEILCSIVDNKLRIGGYCCCFYQGQLLF